MYVCMEGETRENCLLREREREREASDNEAGMKEEEMRERRLHFVLLPYPAQGHVNPMLQLARQLLEQGGCRVTLVHTHAFHVSGPQHPDLRLERLPPDDDDAAEIPSSGIRAKETLARLARHEATVRALLEGGLSAGPSCIITDFLSPFTHLPRLLSLPHAVFWTSSSFCLLALSFDRPADLQVDERVLKNFQPIPQETLNFFSNMFKILEEASHVLVNSFNEMDESILGQMPPNIRLIGPCLSIASNMPPIRGKIFEEDEQCLTWLNEQERSSVIFVSFGSEEWPSSNQMEELSMGIEASNFKFLWVVRPDITAPSFPSGFLERTKERGFITHWAPQLKVLEHPAIGAFLTHCGWNSVMESICMGVPMLCFPFRNDQPMNALMVQWEWKVGIGFEKRSDGLVNRHEVHKVIQCLMHSEEGVHVRAQSSKLKDVARKAIKSSSRAILSSFIKDILATHTTSTLPNSRDPLTMEGANKSEWTVIKE